MKFICPRASLETCCRRIEVAPVESSLHKAATTRHVSLRELAPVESLDKVAPVQSLRKVLAPRTQLAVERDTRDAGRLRTC
jgi:hypothetical protein